MNSLKLTAFQYPPFDAQGPGGQVVMPYQYCSACSIAGRIVFTGKFVRDPRLEPFPGLSPLPT